MLRAVIFDCDGIIANNEPLHLRMFQRVLSEEGISLSEKDYYDIYLGMDDKDCFTNVFKANGQNLTPSRLHDLIERKSVFYEGAVKSELTFFPGALELIQAVSKEYPLAVASGALRHELELILEAGGVLNCFTAIVAAEDVRAGKPNPEGFLKALHAINSLSPKPNPFIHPDQCLVIEDSFAGVAGAKSAEMKCLAVTNSYPREVLHQADSIVDSLEGISVKTLEATFK